MATIENVSINSFKSISESDKVHLNNGITTLVGPNEAGKTGFLEAIEFFSHNNSIGEQNKCDYENSPNLDQVPVIEVEASGINPSDFTVNSSGEEVFEINKEISIKVTKDASGSYEVTSSDIDRELQRYESTRSDRYDAMIGRVNSAADEILENVEKESVGDYGKIEDIINDIQSGSSLRARGGYHPDRASSLQEQLEELRGLLTGNMRNINVRRAAFQVDELVSDLDSLRPAAEIFVDEAFNILMEKEINLIQNKKGLNEISYPDTSDPYANLLQYIGKSPPEIKSMDTRERRDLIKRKMELFSQQFCDAWGQGKVEFDIDLVNNDVHLLITDESTEEQYVEQRSQGFRYFLTFFIRLIASSGGEGITDQVILLDDPGLHLHPERKKDLLSALENLAKNNQIIYTTHSPYMIDSSYLDRIRVVTAQEDHKGTNIKSDFSEIDGHAEDSLKPIRGSLGADFSDSIFTSGQTVLAEGYTDRMYLSTMSHILNEADSDGLPVGCGLLDMGGEGKWKKYCRFLSSENYTYCLLLDGDQAKTASVDEIESIDPINLEQSVFVDEVVDEEDRDVTIEDLLGEDLLVTLVSDIYEVEKEEIDLDTDSQRKLTDQMKEAVGRYYNEDENSRFSKGELADRFVKRAKEEGNEFLTEECKQRFSSTFEEIENSLQTPD